MKVLEHNKIKTFYHKIYLKLYMRVFLHDNFQRVRDYFMFPNVYVRELNNAISVTLRRRQGEDWWFPPVSSGRRTICIFVLGPGAPSSSYPNIMVLRGAFSMQFARKNTETAEDIARKIEKRRGGYRSSSSDIYIYLSLFLRNITFHSFSSTSTLK